MKPLTLYRSATPLLAAIYQLPFNKQLAEGTLARKSFKFYVEQDLLYLATYTLLVKKVAQQFEKLAESNQNSKYARFSETLFLFNKETIAYEEELRQKFLSTRAFTLMFPEPPQKIPVLDAQTTQMLAIADRLDEPFFLTQAMVLITACPWVYLQIGKFLEREKILPITHIPDYKTWVQSYAPNSPFEDSVDDLKRILADVLAPIPEKSDEEQELLNLFLKAIQFEHDFFLAADLTSHRIEHCAFEEVHEERFFSGLNCTLYT